MIRITSRLPYYPLAFKDPVGYSTANLIASGEMKVNTQIANFFSPFISWLAMLVFAGALASVWLIGLKSPTFKSFGRAGRISHLVIVTLYGAALFMITAFARF
jgi:ABC-type multidrug transport system permease subunit